MRRYSVNSIFGPTVQGEGPLAGVVCHFVRLSGCNMWDGREQTKAASLCPYCDTDFLSHTMMTPEAIVERLGGLEPGAEWVWVSGGEPYLQLDSRLVGIIREAGYRVAVETNGTLAPRDTFSLDLVTMSPKLPPDETVLTDVDVLKVLYPHPNPAIRPHHYEARIVSISRYVQPIEGATPAASRSNLQATIEYVYAHPTWRLGLQMHKLLGVA
jgi:7-carboxy-7-deazaguanine synthase